MSSRIWFMRWHVARWMIRTGLKVAPPGRSRSSLVQWIETWGRIVVTEVDRAKRAEASDGS